VERKLLIVGTRPENVALTVASGEPVLTATTEEDAVARVRAGGLSLVAVSPEMATVADRIREHAGGTPVVVVGTAPPHTALTGSSAVIQHVREKIRLVAATRAPVLVCGESGTGKEAVAQEIHAASARATLPLVKVDCAWADSGMIERELFGTAAGEGEVALEGRIERASGGTLLLTEIENLTMDLQVRLLALIEDGEYSPVGSSDTRSADVRLIATTTRNLKEEIRAGRFREDLYYRIGVVPLEVPPLRERREDIPVLVAGFVEHFSRRKAQAPVRFTDEAIRRLTRAYWKGNVRQLQNEIERAVVLRGGQVVDADYFQFEIERDQQMSRIEKAFRFGSIREMEKLMILNRLKENDDNRTRSAETLDISVRTLRNKLNEYNVPRKQRPRAAAEVPAEISSLIG
jgi:two-component system response regulator HydG